jgi:hypothetical protein
MASLSHADSLARLAQRSVLEFCGLGEWILASTWMTIQDDLAMQLRGDLRLQRNGTLVPRPLPNPPMHPSREFGAFEVVDYPSRRGDRARTFR